MDRAKIEEQFIAVGFSPDDVRNALDALLGSGDVDDAPPEAVAVLKFALGEAMAEGAFRQWKERPTGEGVGTFAGALGVSRQQFRALLGSQADVLRCRVGWRRCRADTCELTSLDLAPLMRVTVCTANPQAVLDAVDLQHEAAKLPSREAAMRTLRGTKERESDDA